MSDNVPDGSKLAQSLIANDEERIERGGYSANDVSILCNELLVAEAKIELLEKYSKYPTDFLEFHEAYSSLDQEDQELIDLLITYFIAKGKR